jgi:uncharacterized OB-fold protein
VTVTDARTPLVDGDSQPYWDAIAEHRLTVQRCSDCHRFVFYPRAICPYCHSMRLEWQAVSGAGSVYSFTVSRRASSSEFADELPLVVILVDLDEGYRMMSNLVGKDALAVQCGDRVRIRFEETSGGQVLPVFTRQEPA